MPIVHLCPFRNLRKERKLKEEKIPKEEQNGEVSRRDFLVGAGTVVVGGAIGAGLLSSCGETVTTTVKETSTKTVPTTVTVGGEGAVTVTETKTVGGEGAVTVTETQTVTDPGSGGTLPPALEPEETFCSREINTAAVDVKNGKIIRMRPLHYDSKYPNLRAWSFTSRGKTFTSPLKSPISAPCINFKKAEYHPTRIMYPLQRVDWEPGGDPAKINAQNRGISKYKRISWDTATTIIANEINRVADTYGPEAIVGTGMMCAARLGKTVHAANYTDTALLHPYLWKKYGRTCTEMSWSTDTNIGFATGCRFFWGLELTGKQSGVGVIKDISDHTEMLIGWGSNAHGSTFTVATGTGSANFFLFWKELGIKNVSINPEANRGHVFVDTWIPILPSTDCALKLAIAYVWISEGLYDTDYIETHSIGFDKWQEYVMGDEDGIPKTPEWAAPICQVPEWTIKALARAWASKVTSIYHGFQGGGISRGQYSHENARMEAYLLAMQSWGKPGVNQVNQNLAFPGPTKAPGVGAANPLSYVWAKLEQDTGRRMQTADADRQIVNKNLHGHMWWHKLPLVWWGGNETTTPTSDMFIKRQYPMEGYSKCHMIWVNTNSQLASRVDGARTMEAYKNPEIEFILGPIIAFGDVSNYYDIILPISMKHELYDIGVNQDWFNTLVLEKPAIEAQGESKSDFWAAAEVAKKLDFYDFYTQGRSTEDFVKLGYEKSGVTDAISWEDLYKNNYYSQGPDPNWVDIKPPHQKFYTNPDTNPLQTPTGKLEFYSQQLADNFPGDIERLPVAHYVRGGSASDGYSHDEDPWLSSKASQYPLLMNSPCRNLAWHGCSFHVDIPAIREIKKTKGWDGYLYEKCWINPKDAFDRGIKNEDIVLVTTERGGVLFAAYVTERQMAGCLTCIKAGGADFIVPGKINRAGSVNQLGPGTGREGIGIGVSKHAMGQTPFGFLCQVEKVTGEQWDEWRENYPDAFSRDYHPDYGSPVTGWIEEGGD